MEAIAAQIKELHAQAGEEGRRKILNDLGELQASLDTDWDTVLKLAGGPLQLALVKIGVDLDIFRFLNEHPRTFAEIIKKTGVASDLLGRILRGQASFGLIKEIGSDKFGASRLTTLFSDSNVSGAIEYVFDVLRPIAHTFPGFLKDRKGGQGITSTQDTVFQRAFNTDLGGLDWMNQHPETFGNLFKFLALRPNHTWVEAFPIEEEVVSFNDSNKAVLVDVGGGTGDQAVVFRDKFPHLAGRIIVQETPTTLTLAKPLEGIEFRAHDCFKPQPVRGAKFYYLRYVLHLWQDAECIEVLKALIPALSPSSLVLIDEVVVPDVNVPWQAACQSILMSTALAGAERTLSEWRKLCDEAGFKIVDIFTYDSNMQSVIMIVPKN